MDVVFLHDHRFRRVGQKVFSPGGLSNEVLSRYTKWFNRVYVIGRMNDEAKVLPNYSEITNGNVAVTTRERMFGLIRQSDCVIARLPSINGYLGVLYAKILGKPFLVEVVGCTYDAYRNYGMKGRIAALPAFLVMRYCVKNSPYALYVTSEFLQRRYPCKGTTDAVSDVSITVSDDSILDSRLEKISNLKDELVLGTAAAVDVAYKGQEYVIRAISDIERMTGLKVRYELAGPGDSSRLKSIARDSGVEDKVSFLGVLSHEQVFEWLDSIDLYVQPSLLEGLSRALIEAESRGLPCIASDCGGNPELVEKSQLVSMRKKKSAQKRLANAVAHLVSNHGMAEAAIRNFQFACQEFSPVNLEARRDTFYSKFQSYVARCHS